MKKGFKTLFLGLLGLFALVTFAACSGSSAIQGTWKAQDAAGQNSTITFKDKKLIVDGKTYSYTQNAVGTENGIRYYGIKQDGQTYSIIFPTKSKELAIMIEPNSSDNLLKGKMLYALNKNSQPNYQEYAEKYFK